MDYKYFVYFENKDKGTFRVWFSDTNELKTIYILPKKISMFYINNKKYTSTDEDLIRYGKDIYTANEELKTSKILYKYDYIKADILDNGNLFYKTHSSNIERVFLMKCKKLFEKHEPIDLIECKWFKQSFNGGLVYTAKGIYDCYGYDFSNYYASILASDDFMIPTKPGKERHIDKLYNRIKFGFYLVKISSTDPNVHKLFNFSPKNVYTSYSLKHALELQKTYKIDIELITDCDKNCYIYDLKDLVKASSIFKPWYDIIIGLKKEFPKNILIKMLSSSLWGHLSKKNIICKTYEEIDDENLNVGITDKSDYIILDEKFKDDGTSYLKLQNAKKPYKYNLRLKPFITSFGRVKSASVALLQIEDVLRIYTDGIIFNKPFNHRIPNFIPEDKTTGKIQFKNINSYKKVD